MWKNGIKINYINGLKIALISTTLLFLISNCDKPPTTNNSNDKSDSIKAVIDSIRFANSKRSFAGKHTHTKAGIQSFQKKDNGNNGALKEQFLP